MKIKYLLLTLVVFLIYPFYVNAATCSKEERTRINALVNNIKINYTNISGNNFNISIENVPEELYVILPSGNTVYSYNQDEAKQATYLGGKRYTFRIYSTKNDECINEMNYTKTVYINKYNTYADKEICKDENYKDFIYCNKSYQGNITDEKFEKELKKYEENLNKVEETPVLENKNNTINIYLLIGLGIGILLIVLILIIIIKRSRRKKLKL